MVASPTAIESPYKLLGMPYRYGGDGIDGIDCIHLVYAV